MYSPATRFEIVAPFPIVAPLLSNQVSVIEPVFPATDATIEPVFSPWQFTFVEEVDTVKSLKFVTPKLKSSEQPLLSVMVREYRPAERLKMESLADPLFQLYKYGDNPPFGITLMLPLLELQLAGNILAVTSITAVLSLRVILTVSEHPLSSVIITWYIPLDRLFKELEVFPLSIHK